MGIFATGGAKLFIGTAMEVSDNDLIESSFTSQTWTKIAGLESLGSLGAGAEEIPFDDVELERRFRVKGVRDAGTMEIVMGINYADEGQQALIAAENSNENFAFKLVFDDAPTGGTPSERKFIALVGSVREAYDTANSVMKLTSSLWVNSNVVRLDAAEA